MSVLISILVCVVILAAGALLVQLRRRNVDLWLGSFVAGECRRLASPRRSGPMDVLLCIADHFEPAGNADGDRAIEDWLERYPSLCGEFRDSSGRGPRHTFFYPIDQYVERHVDAIARLCARGHGEVEVHLHHDHDTERSLEEKLRYWTGVLAQGHGLLGRWPDGRIAYGFVHGNWALNNSRPDGRWCGVNDELSVLARTGCYADFTLPSAPSPTQTRTINRLYYGASSAERCKGHDGGVSVGAGAQPRGSLMLMQGPLRLCWNGMRPRIENGCIQATQPPTMERLDRWIRCGIGVAGRPEVVFVKLHTHGAKGPNREVLLGEAMRRFHAGLAARAASDPLFRFHYVTAREMFNIAKAGESGGAGAVAEAMRGPIRGPGPDNNSSFVLEGAKCA